MKCTECKGTGKYYGSFFNTVDNCKLCNGVGHLQNRDAQLKNSNSFEFECALLNSDRNEINATFYERKKFIFNPESEDTINIEFGNLGGPKNDTITYAKIYYNNKTAILPFYCTATTNMGLVNVGILPIYISNLLN